MHFLIKCLPVVHTIQCSKLSSLKLSTKMVMSYNFRGFVAPVLAPFTDGLTLNLSMVPIYARYLADRGIKGVLVNGTSGEGMSLSVAERKQLAESWANAVKSTKQHLMIQVGGAPLPDVLALAKHAEEIKADAILCLPELYIKPTDVNQLIYYLKIVGLAAPKTPLLYYHIPMFTNVNLHMGTFFAAVRDKIPTFVGIKFTSANLEEATQAISANDKLVIYLGNDQIMPAAHAIGIDSFITTSVNIFPEKALAILDACKTGRVLKAKELQEDLNKAVIAISKHGNWLVTMKTGMSLLTPMNLGPVRPPNQTLTQENVESMKRDLRNLGYDLKN